jgi:hypothetical protein
MQRVCRTQANLAASLRHKFDQPPIEALSVQKPSAGCAAACMSACFHWVATQIERLIQGPIEQRVCENQAWWGTATYHLCLLLQN